MFFCPFDSSSLRNRDSFLTCLSCVLPLRTDYSEMIFFWCLIGVIYFMEKEFIKGKS